MGSSESTHRITAKAARTALFAELAKKGYILERQNVIDYYFRAHERIAVAQVRTHIGITRLALTFGLDHELTNRIVLEVQPHLHIWNVRNFPFLHCSITEPFLPQEFGTTVSESVAFELYYSGVGAPEIPQVAPSNLTMILPKQIDLAVAKIWKAVSFEDAVFAEALPAIDKMLPCLEPAWFLCNSFPTGNAIVMLARAMELGKGREQLGYFEAFMERDCLRVGSRSSGWRGALPAIEKLVSSFDTVS